MIGLYLGVMVILVSFPTVTALSARDALAVWGLDILPTLFPYMVLCRMLSTRLRSLPIPAAPVCLLLGLIGGSPCGAAVINLSADRLSARSLHALCAITGTISPMFFLGTMRLWTQNPPLCRILLFIHWTGAISAAAIVWFLHRNALTAAAADSTHAFENPISQSIDAILHVGGCIICFSVLAGFLKLIPQLGSFSIAVIHALLEISGGVQALCSSGSTPCLPVLLAALTGFSGLSVITQNSTFLKSSGISLTRLAAYGLLRALCSGAIMALWQVAKAQI